MPIFPYLRNGLGNRLFIYFTGLGLAMKHKTSLFLLRALVEDCEHQTVSYEVFFPAVANALIPYPHENIFDCYDEEPEIDGTKNYILRGLYHTMKFWKDIQDLVKEQCQPPNHILQYIRVKYADIDEARFIHIRRGDYLALEAQNVNLEWYHRRCMELSTHILCWYVVSNDPEWCKTSPLQNLSNVRFIEENEVITLFLMSLCGQGGICANSTFSWWGGFLNPHKIYFPSKVLNHFHTQRLPEFLPENFELVEVEPF